MLLPGLKFVRHAAGLSQGRLSEKSGVHRDTIQKLESGQRPARPATVKRLADAMGIEAEALADDRKERHELEEARAYTVPGFYPEYDDADIIKGWDGSEEAWLWAELTDFRDRSMAESAARVVAVLGEGKDLSGVMEFLWTGLDAEDAAEFIEVHKESIEGRARDLRVQEG